VRSPRPLTVLIAAAVGASAAACSAIPTAPSPLPSDWIPSATPDPIDPLLLDSPLGFDLSEESAVRIRTSTCENLGNGTGFVLDSTTIVTNRHVVEDFQWIEVNGPDGSDIAVESVSTSQVADIAIIVTVEPLTAVVSFGDEDPAPGDYVKIVGYPLGDELTTSTGTIISSEEDLLDNADHVFLTSASADHGSSGSAAYDREGHVFGVLYAGNEETKQGIIIPLSIVEKALDDLTPLAAVTTCS